MRNHSKELKYAILTDVSTKYWTFAISYAEEMVPNDGVCDVIEKYNIPKYSRTKTINNILKRPQNYKEVKIGFDSWQEPSRCYLFSISEDEFEACKIILGVSLNRDIMEYVKKYKKVCPTTK